MLQNAGVFVHFDLQMCLAPQRRAILGHLSFKIGPNMWCFAHFDLERRFAPTRFWCFVHFDLDMRFAPQWRTIFCGSELPKLVRARGVLYILTGKCASRHSGVPFFISLLNSYLRTRRFSGPTFRTSGTTNH